MKEANKLISTMSRDVKEVGTMMVGKKAKQSPS